MVDDPQVCVFPSCGRAFVATIHSMADWTSTTVDIDGEQFNIQHAQDHGTLKVCVWLDGQWSEEATTEDIGDLETLLHRLTRQIVEEGD